MIDTDIQANDYWDLDPDPDYIRYHEWLELHAQCRRGFCRILGTAAEGYSGRYGTSCPEISDLNCFICEAPRRVVRVGGIVNRADPTQTYVLRCGHYAI